MKNNTRELEGLTATPLLFSELLGTQARREGWTKEEIENFTKEAMAGDYDHLLQTVIKYIK